MIVKGWLSKVRFAAVFLVWGIATLCYFSFSHYVHHRHFHFEHHDGQNTSSEGTHQDHRRDQEGGDEHGGHENHHHGRSGDFDKFHLVKDKLFFYGLALPLALLNIAGLLVWNKHSSSPKVGVFQIALMPRLQRKGTFKRQISRARAM